MSDQQLAVREAAALVNRASFDNQTKELIRKTVSDPRNPLTNDEFDLFIAVCQHIGANPLLREAYALKDRSGRFSIAIGIDKFRQQTQENPRYIGQAGPFWCGADGQWKDVWLDAEKPQAAKVGIWMRGAREPTWGVATLKASFRNTPQWNDNTAHMLAVRAESHAHRKCSSRLAGSVVLREDEGTDFREIDEDGIIHDEPPALAPAPRSQRQQAVIDEMTAAVTEGETRQIEPDELGATDAEWDGLDRQPAAAAGPRWTGSPLGRQVSALVDALTEAGKKFSLPADDASDADLTGWIASKRGLLGQQKH